MVDSEPGAPASTAACWLVHAGTGAEHLTTFFDRGIATISWGSIPGLGDPSHLSEKDLRALLLAAGRGQPGADMKELFGFRDDMARGDLIVSPDRPQVDGLAIGRITGDYSYSPVPVVGDHRHIRSVDWLVRCPRSDLPDDLQDTLTWRRTVRLLPHQEGWLAFIHQEIGGAGEPPASRLQDQSVRRSAAAQERPASAPSVQCTVCGLTRAPSMFENSAVCRDCI